MSYFVNNILKYIFNYLECFIRFTFKSKLNIKNCNINF